MPARSALAPVPPPNSKVLEQVRGWRDDLINLSKSNRLLHFRATRTSTIEIREPDAVEVFGRLLEPRYGGWAFFMPPEPASEQSTPVPVLVPSRRSNELLTDKDDPQKLTAALRALKRRAEAVFMDTGLSVLYLAVGMLRWKPSDEEGEAQSPLLLVPVGVQQETPREPFHLVRGEEDPTINPALAVKLKSEFGIELPATDDVDDISIPGLFSSVRAAIGAHTSWRLEPRLILTTFSFHKEAMYRDLQENEQTIAMHQAIVALAEGPGTKQSFDFDLVPEDRLDEIIPPEEMASIRDADASQRQCIYAAKSGRSFVMDGPPGTGKSQTIANIIAELMVAGKTVLFVSEKIAALEVVHARLMASGLAEYLLELHSHKATRREVAQELGRALRTQPRGRPELPEPQIARLIARRKELSAYVEAMNELRAALGISLFQAIGRISRLQSLPTAPWPPAQRLDMDVLQQLLRAASALGRAWGPVERGRDFVWFGVRVDAYDIALKREIEAQVQAAMDALGAFRKVVGDAAQASGLDWTASAAQANRLIAVLEHVLDGASVPVRWLSAPDLDAARHRIEELEPVARHLHEAVESFGRLGIVNPTGLPASSATTYLALSRQLKEVLPDLSTTQAATAEALADVAGFLEGAHEQLMNIEVMAQEVGSAFGIHEDSLSLQRAAEMAELGLMMAKGNAPEPNWLNPLVLRAATEAANVLPRLAQDYRSRREVLTETFTDQVLDLDLDGLCVRFKSVHRGPFKMFHAAYRSDRRTLASCTRGGKITRHVINRLDDARAWQKATLELAAEEQRLAAVLGSSYQRDHTDFTALAAAIETAQRAVAISGPHLHPATVAKQIARGGSPDPQIHRWAQELDERIRTWETRARALLGSSLDRFSATPLASARQVCRELRPVVSQLAQLLDQITTAYLSSATRTVAQELCQWRLAIEEANGTFTSSAPMDAALLGPAYRGPDTDWNELRRSVQWTDQLLQLLGGRVSEQVAESLLHNTRGSDAIKKARSTWGNARISLLARFLPARAHELEDLLERDFETSTETLSRLRATVSDVEEWIAFLKAKKELDQAGLQAITAFCFDQMVSAGHVEGIVERAVLERWVNDEMARDSRLKDLRPEDREHCVAEFRQLDRRLIEAASARIIAQSNSRRPRVGIGQAAIIDREANKQRRHMPVKRLLKETWEVAKALKPCFMMSPLSVSQFIDTDMRFDAVIFDEASQVKPCDAINCIYRGSQLIVAGDNKQLPPTTFWEAVTEDGGDEYVEGQVEDFQSVLDLCKGSGAYRSLSLMWHYRSQHEALITYSNHSFYEGSLITFPGAVQMGSDLGVQLYRVPGVYRRSAQRDNPVEAKSVADRVIFHADNHPTLSIGVVTFSEAQATAIEGEIDRRRSNRRDLDGFFKPDRLNGFFVKNLESVQGDERDIMIFSLGYGPDEFGRFTLNFGPLNQNGGHRRLNVAITRARRRVEVVSSVRASDFVGDIQEGGGVWHLRRYLDFLERGVPVLGLPVETERAPDSDLEEEVATTIRSWGFDVVPQVGTAGYRVDLGVRIANDTTRYILGVECDGAMYHSSRVARDRDRLRQQVLEGLGWRLHRIWAPAWFRDRSREEARLRAAIDAGVAAPRVIERRDERGPVASSLPESPDEVDDVEMDGPPAWTIPYEVAKPRPPRRSVDMHLPEAVQDIRRMISEVVRVEGPVAEALVIRRVREAWGVGRTGQRIQAAFDEQFSWLSRNGILERDRSFVGMRNQELTSVRTPSDDPASMRKSDEVPPDEIDLALSHMAAEAIAASTGDLTDAVARIFGWQRRGADIMAVLAKAINRLVRQGNVRRSGDSLQWIGGSLSGMTERVVRPRTSSSPVTSLEALSRDETRDSLQAGIAAEVDRQSARAEVEVRSAAPAQGEEDSGDEIPANIAKYVTAEGYETLKHRLEEMRSSPGNPAKIHDLEKALDDCVIMPRPHSFEKVGLGCRVTFVPDGGAEETYLLVGPLEASAAAGKLNVLSPVGGALWGRRVGEVVDVALPGTDAYKIQIRGITG